MTLRYIAARDELVDDGHNEGLVILGPCGGCLRPNVWVIDGMCQDCWKVEEAVRINQTQETKS